MADKMMMPCIAAISTPHGVGGIGVVRLSGEDAFVILERVFKPAKERPVNGIPGYTAVYGRIFDPENGEPIDEAVAVIFRAPKSFTGENVAEISCHGGIYLMQKALRACISAGAAPALPGEFTRRAFLNGKMDLAQAEAVSELIYAEDRFSSQAALAARDGELSRRLTDIKADMLAAAAHIAAYTDYPEEDVEPVTVKELRTLLESSRDRFRRILSDGDKGSMISGGIPTAIIGKPNVGKSSLMNILSGCDRSIVTDIPGTTRDVVSDRVDIGGITLDLSDTAGMRETTDPVEMIGVERAEKAMKRSSLIIAVFDSSQPLEDSDRRIIDMIRNRRAVAVINKCDLKMKIQKEEITKACGEAVTLSAKTKEGCEELIPAILRVIGVENCSGFASITFNERRRACITGAVNALSDAVSAIDEGFTLDAVSVCLDEALMQLFSLTGENVSDAVVDEVFSRFCVGK